MDFSVLRQCLCSASAVEQPTTTIPRTKHSQAQNWPKIITYDHVHQIFITTCTWFRRGVLCDGLYVGCLEKWYKPIIWLDKNQNVMSEWCSNVFCERVALSLARVWSIGLIGLLTPVLCAGLGSWGTQRGVTGPGQMPSDGTTKLSCARHTDYSETRNTESPGRPFWHLRHILRSVLCSNQRVTVAI